MTHQEILASIESLPKDEQIAVAKAIIDRLEKEGSLSISESLKAEFLRREVIFFANPNQGEPWEQVKTELFGS